MNADGEIGGRNVTLDYANSILNTGAVSAQNLTVKTGTLTDEERSTNIGTIYQKVSGGVAVTTGTVVVQQGGLMSGANYNLNVQAINQIGGALQQVNADGSLNQAATAHILANLKIQLGGDFTQSAVSDDLNTTVIADSTGGWSTELVELAAVAVISAMTAGVGAAAVGTAAGTVEEGVANAAVTALANSLAMDAMNGSFSLAGLTESMAIAMVTVGATNGITFDSNTDSLGLAGWNTPVGSGVSTLGQLAGVTPAVGTGSTSDLNAMAVDGDPAG